MGDKIDLSQDIELSRGQAGLGFNIKGGVDIPHIPGDPGIFVAKIREKGAAAEDGRLNEGDKIIEINGHNVEKVQHKEAVAHFLNAGNTVKLRVIPGAEDSIKKQALEGQNHSAVRPDSIGTTRNTKSSSSISGPVILGIGLAALALAVVIGYRYSRR